MKAFREELKGSELNSSTEAYENKTKSRAKHRSRGPVGPWPHFLYFSVIFGGPQGPEVLGNASGDLSEQFSIIVHGK